jgi:hypothetical protein
MNTIILKNGIIAGCIISLFMAAVTMYIKEHPELQPSVTVGFLGMFLGFTFVIIGIMQVKVINNGVISFGKAFLTGFLISLIASILYVVVWFYIYYNHFPNFIEQYSAMMISHAKPEDLAKVTEEMNQYKEYYESPVMIVLLTLMEILPLGIAVTLIGSFFLKKN